MTAKPPLLLKFTLFLTLAGSCTARTTLLITGHSTDNAYKYAFAQQFVHENELFRETSLPHWHFLVIGPHSHNGHESSNQIKSVVTDSIDGNLTRLIVTELGTDEMSMDDLQMFYDFIKSSRALVVVEIGYQAPQTLALLNKGATCWGEATAKFMSPNTAYLCNDLMPEATEKIVDLSDLTHPAQPIEIDKGKEEDRVFWPGVFAAAAKADRKNRKNKVIMEDEEEIEEIVSTIQDHEEEELVNESDADNQQGEKENPHKHLKLDRKVHCKYRKSCYETGHQPDISNRAALSSFNFNLFSFADEMDQSSDSNDTDSTNDDIIAVKLKCKYRTSCYKERNVPLTPKDEEREDRKQLLSSKRNFEQGKKRTLKDIAQKTVRTVKRAEEKAATRPLPTNVLAERNLNKIGEELDKKVQCKYRKSCYETGEKPQIADWTVPNWLSFKFAPVESEQTSNYQDMDELERKVHCKYRKSCYDTGVRPDIELEFAFNSFSDLTLIPEVLESSRPQTLQERCKYRKSCYKTGIVPDLSPKDPEVNYDEHITHIIPTNVQDLKVLCKYRKSCYEEVAASDSVETIRNIRKKRLIERHAKMMARKARRSRIRRHQRAMLHGGTSHKHSRKERQAEQVSIIAESLESIASQMETQLEEKEVMERKKKEIKKATQEQEIETEIPMSKPVQSEQTEERKSKKLKKQAKDMENEPHETVRVAQAEIEESKEKPWQKKKVKIDEVEDTLTISQPTPQLDNEPRHRKNKKKEKQEFLEVKEEKKPARKVKPKKEEQEKQKKSKPKETDKPEKPEEEAQIPNKTEDMQIDSDTLPENLQEKRDYCRYRKSCYQDGKRPSIKQSFTTLFGEFEHHVEHVYSDSALERSEADQKLHCKYRKSCYETGNLPDFQSSVHAPIVEGPHHSLTYEHSVLDKKLLCKYRKSCYEEKGFSFDEEDDKASDEPKTLHNPKPAEPKVVMKHKHKANKREEKREDNDNEDENKETKVYHPEDQANQQHNDLEVDQKLECKYRRSCYGTTKSRSKNQDHSSGSMTRQEMPIRTKCNIYYLSCREQLGLPPKEKAPIGPNGRRLCRKKKPEQG